MAQTLRNKRKEGQKRVSIWWETQLTRKEHEDHRYLSRRAALCCRLGRARGCRKLQEEKAAAGELPEGVQLSQRGRQHRRLLRAPARGRALRLAALVVYLR